MASHPRRLGPRGQRRSRPLRPSLLPLESRVVLSYTFPGIAGIAFDSSGDVFVSYNSESLATGQAQSVAEVGASGRLLSDAVFTTQGSSAFPGALTAVGSSPALPSVGAGDILELQPNGQLFEFNPTSGASSQYDDLPDDTLSASKAYDVQTGGSVDLTDKISLSGATYGDFGFYQDDLVVSAESNDWDFVMRVTYGSSGSGAATVLAASPASDGLAASPGGVAVDSQGTVLATMPYLPSGATTAIHVPVGFSISYDTGSSPAPFLPTLGLTSVPNIDSGGIAVDSQNNFLLAVSDSSLYGGGQGIVHINGALTAFLADPTSNSSAIPSAIAYQDVGGTNYLAFTDIASDTYTLAGELSLFSGQVTPAQLRGAYGITQIQFAGPGGTTVTGDGTGQTIAIVEEGVDPTLAADLATFDQFFGIPAPPSLQIIDQDNVTTQNLSIVGEASLDVEWAHAVAPGASIVIYNAAYDPDNSTTSVENLITAMQEASKLPGVSVVSLSYGIPEASLADLGLDEQTLDADFTTPGVTFVAAAGDSGAYGDGGYQLAVNYPAASPDVLSVGGTSVVIDAAGDYPGTGPSGEIAWGSGTQSGSDGGGGGGLSTVEPEPSWQVGVVPSTMDPDDARAVPDVSMDSGAAQEYDVFTSTLSGSSVSASAVGWLGDAGTSAGAPIWAGLIAIANQGRVLAGGSPLTGNTQTLPALYSLPSADFHDIVNGDNGYPAGPGYDLASGLGTPVANLLVPALADYGLASRMTIQTEPPSSVAADSTFGLTVQVEDSQGQAVSGGSVTVALGNDPGGATLGGVRTEPVVDGVATFSDLTLSQPGTGYTLTVTDSSISTSQTTTAITVTAAASDATQVAVTASPSAPVYGQAVTLSATVDAVNPGIGIPTGSVTFTEGSTTLGTVTLTDGVATLATTPADAGAASITAVYSGDDQSSQFVFSLTVGRAAAKLTLGDLGATYDGSAHSAAVTTSPAGLSGVTVTYTLDGGAVADPTRAGDYTVTATLNNPNFTATAATGTLVIGQATPTITWADPANITAGTELGDAQLDATATFDGKPLSGTLTYTPAAGTVLPTGSGQALTVTFTPTDATDFQAVTDSVPINVLPQSTPTPTPTPVTIIGEVPVFERKVNRKGKPVGKPVLTGFTLDFSAPLDAAAATNPGNYELESITTRKVKKKVERIPQFISAFKVSYSPASDSVTLELAGAETFPKGGQLAVLPGTADGSGGALDGATVFAISPGGKSIGPS